MAGELEQQLGNLSSSIEGAVVDELREQLGTLETSINRIPSPTPPPRTTLQVQGAAGSEGAWQKYLAYFLSPSAHHGLGTDALNRFLEGLSNHTGGFIPDHAPDYVEVFTERTSDAGNQPDLVIWQKGRFFVCCELKLYSREGENQTRRYAQDDQVGRKSKEEVPEQGHHYVYIRRPGGDMASADQFVNLTWRQVKEWLAPLLYGSRGRYPARTTAQLSDFLDTIQQDMTEDRHLRTEQKKMELYFEHLDAIRQAKGGLETIWEHERENWRRRFLEDYLPETWSEQWHCNPNVYGQFYHSKWRQDGGLQLPEGQVKMHFVHLIRNQESFEKGRLTVQLRWPGSQNKYKDRFTELFMSDRFADIIDPAMGEYDVTKAPNISRNNPRLTEKIYDVDRSGLPESYYETLSTAVKEHQQLAPAINEVLGAAIKDVDEGR